MSIKNDQLIFPWTQNKINIYQGETNHLWQILDISSFDTNILQIIVSKTRGVIQKYIDLSETLITWYLNSAVIMTTELFDFLINVAQTIRNVKCIEIIFF